MPENINILDAFNIACAEIAARFVSAVQDHIVDGQTHTSIIPLEGGIIDDIEHWWRIENNGKNFLTLYQEQQQKIDAGELCSAAEVRQALWQGMLKEYNAFTYRLCSELHEDGTNTQPAFDRIEDTLKYTAHYTSYASQAFDTLDGYKKLTEVADANNLDLKVRMIVKNPHSHSKNEEGTYGLALVLTTKNKRPIRDGSPALSFA